MATGSGDLGFKTHESTPHAAAEPEPAAGVEQRQMAGYRILDVKAPGERDLEQKARMRSRRLKLTDKTYQLLDFAFVVLYGLLGIRFLLGLAAANQQAGFVRFINLITQPFFGPFRDIVASPRLGDGSFDLPLLICLLVFLLLHLAVRGLLRVLLGARARTDG